MLCTNLLHHINRNISRSEGPQNAVPQWAMNAMKNENSFHGSITRTEAAKILIDSERSCYLTRYSDYHKFCIISVLRVSNNGELLQHLKLHIPQDSSSQGMYKVTGAEKEFDNIADLLKYYESHPKNDKLGNCLKSNAWQSINLASEDVTSIACYSCYMYFIG